MKRIYINELNKYFNKEVTINGVIDKIRNMQYVQFIILRDISGKVQITIEKNDNNCKLNEIVDTLTNESTLKVKGIILENENVKLGGMEIIPSDIEVEPKKTLNILVAN